MKRELDVLSISPVTGCSGDGIDTHGNTFSLSGMGQSERNFCRVKIGGWIIDKRQVKNFVTAVIQAPILDLGLKPNQVSRLTDKDIACSLFAQAVMSDPSNGFGHLFRLEKMDSNMRPERKFGSLDSVGLGHYLDYWNVLGARIGRVMDCGSVKWNTDPHNKENRK